MKTNMAKCVFVQIEHLPAEWFIVWLSKNSA